MAVAAGSTVAVAAGSTVAEADSGHAPMGGGFMAIPGFNAPMEAFMATAEFRILPVVFVTNPEFPADSIMLRLAGFMAIAFTAANSAGVNSTMDFMAMVHAY